MVECWLVITMLWFQASLDMIYLYSVAYSVSTLEVGFLFFPHLDQKDPDFHRVLKKIRRNLRVK